MSEVKVPVGYKQTEVGVIPEDWEVKDLGSFLVFKNGLNKAKEFFGYGTPIVNYMDVYKSGAIQPSNIAGKVFVTADEIKNYSALKGDVFFTRTSETVEEIGLSSVLIDDIENAVFSGFVLRARQKKETLEHSFMKYCFRSKSTRDQIQGTASYTTRALTNGKLLSNVLVPIPPKPEQTAIANALTDTDNLIESLEKLIAKKEVIKTGSMQQLLTGKTRLPEFATSEDGSAKGFKQTELGKIPEDWTLTSMKDLGTTYGGLSSKNKADFGTGNSYYVPFTNVMANVVVDLNQLDKVNINEMQNKVLLNDLLFNGSSETPEEVCLCSVVKSDLKNLYLNSFCFGFRPKGSDQYSPLFLAYWFRSEVGRKAVFNLAQGSTRYNISKSQFMKLNLFLPSIKEQTAIATILSDMDAEIDALQDRLEKTKAIKQGMMQQLLTGKVRLVSPGQTDYTTPLVDSGTTV